MKQARIFIEVYILEKLKENYFWMFYNQSILEYKFIFNAPYIFTHLNIRKDRQDVC